MQCTSPLLRRCLSFDTDQLSESRVKKIKRMKEIEARQTTSTDGDVSGPVDNKAVGCEKNKKGFPQKAGRVEKRKSVKSAKAGDLLAKIKDEESDQ